MAREARPWGTSWSNSKTTVSLSSSNAVLAGATVAPPSGVRRHDRMAISMQFSSNEAVGSKTSTSMVSAPRKVNASRSGSSVMS